MSCNLKNDNSNDNLFLRILGYLDFVSLQQASLVSTSFRSASQSHELWKMFVRKIVDRQEIPIIKKDGPELIEWLKQKVITSRTHIHGSDLLKAGMAHILLSKLGLSKVSEAEPHAKKLLEDGQRNCAGDLYYEIAMEYKRQGKLEEAETYLPLINFIPNRTQAACRIMQEYLIANKADEALQLAYYLKHDKINYSLGRQQTFNPFQWRVEFLWYAYEFNLEADKMIQLLQVWKDASQVWKDTSYESLVRQIHNLYQGAGAIEKADKIKLAFPEAFTRSVVREDVKFYIEKPLLLANAFNFDFTECVKMCDSLGIKERLELLYSIAFRQLMVMKKTKEGWQTYKKWEDLLSAEKTDVVSYRRADPKLRVYTREELEVFLEGKISDTIPKHYHSLTNP